MPATPRFAFDTAAATLRHPGAFRPNWRMIGLTAGVSGSLVGLFVFGLVQLEFSPARFMTGSNELWRMVGLMLPPHPGTWSRVWLYVHAMGETLAISILGTCIAAVAGLPLGFLSARNVLPVWIARFLVRRTSDTLRGIDILIWALVWVNVVGLGPFAGLLAIFCSDSGTFGKLFSEAIEAADRKPVEGVVAAGGGSLHSVRFGLLPQVLPVFASQVLYYIESNTRSATIIGIVGAGGIGLHLYEQVRTLEWQAVSFIVVLILLAVALIDLVSGQLRRAIIGRREGAAAIR